MKIVYIISTLENKGPVNVLYNTIKYLDRTLIDPVVITLSPEKKYSRFEDFKNLGIDIYQLNLGRFEGIFFSVSKIKRIFKEIEPLCIQANCFRSNIIVGFFFSKYKTISIIHNYPYKDYIFKFGKHIGFLMHLLSKFLYRRFKVLIAVSESLKENINNKYKINSISIKNGIDIDCPLFNTHASKQDIRNELGLEFNSKVFVFLDSLILIKDPETTIQGFLNAFCNKNILLIVGGGNLLSELKIKYARNTNIIFIGMTSEPFKYLKASDYYISSSLSESFHLSVAEAMFCGLFLVLSDIDAHQEFISLDKSIGVTFKPNNVSDLTDKLQNLDSRNLNYSIMNSPKLVIENLTAETMSEKYQELYEKLKNE